MSSFYTVAVLEVPLQLFPVLAAPPACLRPVCSQSRDLQLLDKFYQAYADQASPFSGVQYLTEGGHKEDALYRYGPTLALSKTCLT